MLVTRAETRAGHRYELAGADDDQAEARHRATRAAGLLAVVGRPEEWEGSRVTVTDAGSGRLVFVARIVRREGARHER